jgi:hypothetical protein
LPNWAKAPLAAAAALVLTLAVVAVTQVYLDWQETREFAMLEEENDRQAVTERKVVATVPASELAKSPEPVIDEALRAERMPDEPAHTTNAESTRLPSSGDTVTTPSNATETVVVSPPSVPSPVPSSTAPESRIPERVPPAAPPDLARPEVRSLANRPLPLQSGWLDLGTRVFYARSETNFALGGYVRGRLDERNDFILTSTQVEGPIEALSQKQAAARGTHGWLELSSLRFVASRPGLSPSFPYIEGYQDGRGEFHPTARKIHRAGD